MLDPKYIREHAADVRENCRRRNSSADVDAWLELDARRLKSLKEVEAVRAERNAVAESMKGAQTPEERDPLIARGKALKDELAVKESGLAELEIGWKELLLSFPNLTHPDVPIGKDDTQNVEIRRVGEVKQLSHPLDHVQLAEKHGLIDFVRGAKVAGTKFYYLKGKGALLEQALVKFALDYLVGEGFVPMSTPDVAKDEVLVGTGYNPRGPETQIYSIENSDLSLIGTSEITIGGYHKDEILDASDLPLKYAGISHCYRTEAGAYGKESYGLYRVHQFTKVEQFVFCAPEQSEAMLLEIQRNSENLFKMLEIPFRVIEICTGDFGNPHYRKYDIEAWMWGRGEGKGDWGEVTSASNCTDYQARRLNIRLKTEQGENVYVHTLNNTAFAVSRTLIALLENHQQEDGSIKIPAALVPYCGFDKIG